MARFGFPNPPVLPPNGLADMVGSEYYPLCGSAPISPPATGSSSSGIPSSGFGFFPCAILIMFLKPLGGCGHGLRFFTGSLDYSFIHFFSQVLTCISRLRVPYSRPQM